MVVIVTWRCKHLFVFFIKEMQACIKRTVKKKHKVTQCSTVGLVVLTQRLIAGVVVSQSSRCESPWRCHLERYKKKIAVSVLDG